MRTKSITALAVSLAVLGAAANAQQPTFVSLFNGKDLTGWKVPPATTATGRSSTA